MTFCFIINVEFIFVIAFSISEFVLFRLSTVLFSTSYDSFTYFTSDSKSSLIFSNSAIFLSFSSQTLQDSKHFKHGFSTSTTFSIIFSTSMIFSTSTTFSTSTIFRLQQFSLPLSPLQRFSYLLSQPLVL
ncbi:hypothetical protein HanRHA438_Chr10g0467901 [Helianthus annuus]|nr:hypothetical protein HanHA300_Chr10g0374021 [Helianthus annuus]KAJ0523148.1 hypothetical protein HanIR_Chr10g0490571 [Helianthus annuus]KAJ0530998.1 hypothetical protein HanHA89_Chr10g0396241 [Helianthus annuus]KAJ0880858.1 hypothetical protein HanRHA438_Chr10g0467901 [Helianthus annuus]